MLVLKVSLLFCVGTFTTVFGASRDVLLNLTFLNLLNSRLSIISRARHPSCHISLLKTVKALICEEMTKFLLENKLLIKILTAVVTSIFSV